MKSENPKISIITITYNAEKELPATLESIKRQTFTNFEHIIVDGASSDGTLSIARQASTPSMRILSEPDKGLYFAMNKGLDLARGEYILFLNAGDSFHNANTLSLYAQATFSKPDIIYGDTIIVDDDRNFLRNRHLSAPAQLTANSFKNGMLICHQAFMVRKKIASHYNTSYRFSSDYDWTLNCIEASESGRCINLDTITIDYLDAGTTEKNKIKSLAERYCIMSRHFGKLSTLIYHISFIPRAIKGIILKKHF